MIHSVADCQMYLERLIARSATMDDAELGVWLEQELDVIADFMTKIQRDTKHQAAITTLNNLLMRLITNINNSMGRLEQQIEQQKKMLQNIKQAL